VSASSGPPAERQAAGRPATTVHLLRHGEVHNPEGLLYGRLPGYLLSELGTKMAYAAADALDGRDVRLVVASPLERAQDTARPVAERFGLEVGVDDRLVESANWFEGKRVGVGDGVLRNPRYWRQMHNPFLPSWGEPYAEIAARMRAALLAARELAEGGEAVLVSHQLPIWTLRRSAEGKKLWHDPRRRECGLASLTSFRFEGTEIVATSYREPAAHLVARSPTGGRSRGA